MIRERGTAAQFQPSRWPRRTSKARTSKSNDRPSRTTDCLVDVKTAGIVIEDGAKAVSISLGQPPRRVSPSGDTSPSQCTPVPADGILHRCALNIQSTLRPPRSPQQEVNAGCQFPAFNLWRAGPGDSKRGWKRSAKRGENTNAKQGKRNCIMPTRRATRTLGRRIG
jgi:hypothetical protein